MYSVAFAPVVEWQTDTVVKCVLAFQNNRRLDLFVDLVLELSLVQRLRYHYIELLVSFRGESVTLSRPEFAHMRLSVEKTDRFDNPCFSFSKHLIFLLVQHTLKKVFTEQ